MRELVFISVQPADLYFVWQVDVQLHNFQQYGYDKLAHVLVFMKKGEAISREWLYLQEHYPNTKFFFYWDTANIEHTFIPSFNYIPLLRPWTLRQHFKKYPELAEKAIFYHDSDIIFTKYLNFDKFLDNEINYLSYTGAEDRGDNYLNYDYFIRKRAQVDPKKIQQFLEADPLKKFAAMFDLTPDVIKQNNDKTGGAQYLMKGIDEKFWADVFDGCLFLKTGMHNYNQRYFEGATNMERENNGFQAWCADMWSVLWNLWRRGMQTECPKELDFAWATDPIDKWDRVYIYHDAGKTADTDLFNKKGPQVIHPDDYNKRVKRQTPRYASNIAVPFEDDLEWVNPAFCSKNYVRAIKETRTTKYFN